MRMKLVITDGYSHSVIVIGYHVQTINGDIHACMILVRRGLTMQ